MKLSSINNIRLNNNFDEKNKVKNNRNYNLNTNVQNNDIAFGGATNFLVNFWQWVENGGRAISFTVEDMGGTNFPRTIMGMFAGFRYTHKINFNSLKQEGIREFLTGPTMTFMPMAVLAGMKMLCGKSVNTHIDNLRNLSYLAQDTIKDGTMDENSFIYKVTQDLLEKTINKNALEQAGQDISQLTKNDVDNLAQVLIEYKDNLKNTQITPKERKQQTKELLNKAQDTFSEILKRTKDSYNNCSFLDAKYSVSDSKVGATKFKDYVEYIGDYVNDFSQFSKKSIHNLDSKGLINKFKNKYIGNRAITIVCMVAITSCLMSYIPKLYTWASGGINPNAKDIYNEADKKKETGGN